MIRRHAYFIGLLIAIALARFAILFLSQTHVHSDEAIIGLMGKHILEGRYFPFYMYGQSYNAGAAGEAYLATLAFAVFGVGVVPLKSCIVVLSLVCLVLFYGMGCALYRQRTALFAAIAFVFAPSLLRWHFQVRGYSWYFLSIPLLALLFLSIQSSPRPKRRLLFLFGLASGASVWCLELALTLNIALWVMLAWRRNFLLRNGLLAMAGFIAGYAPAIAFNLTHHLQNWQTVLAQKTGGDGFASLLHPATFGQIFWSELPKFFGPDTILWYYPERPLPGFVFYAIAVLAFGLALWPFLKNPGNIFRGLRGDAAAPDQESDLVMIVLTCACFVPYLAAPMRVPGYFLAGTFFLSILSGRLLERLLFAKNALLRMGGATVLGAAIVTGSAAMVDVARHNQIETLTLCEQGERYCMTRIPGRDIEGVQHDIREHQLTSIWTTVSFVYPLLFESREALAVSDSVFGYEHRILPPEIPWQEPGRDAGFVLESDSPFRVQVEARCREESGLAPRIMEYGKLTVVEKRSH